MLGRLLVGIAVTLGAGSARAESAHGHDGLGGATPTRGDGPRHVVAFTFDDGPSETLTPRILDTLAAHDVPATFFVVGRDLAARPERRAVLTAIVEAGHTIGNHTFSHARLTALSPARRDAELDRLATLVEEATGVRPTAVRPPYGASSPALRAALVARGLTEVRWNIDPQDWVVTSAASLRARLVASIIAQEGGIVLLHDTKRVTAKALPGVLADLDEWNCGRVRRGQEPIIPVSLHYFMRDADGPRPIPPEVAARTERYRDALVTRCEGD